MIKCLVIGNIVLSTNIVTRFTLEHKENIHLGTLLFVLTHFLHQPTFTIFFFVFSFLILVLDEDFIFEARPTTISKRVLEIIMYNFDAYSRHHSIGHVKIPLEEVDLSDRSLMWRYLEPCTSEDTKVMLPTLKHLATAWYKRRLSARWGTL